ncbi:hypothetical protein [Haloarchaeobius sp. HME9146]|uniref:DUF7123 family protein n=1 Tax=Haloarchaeobius sp. HME9146 TaxID=2978732 RepID=UPI0021C0CEE9|nr:hypothetical protein [Haloarchaeobius sp. HME9146]MCT9098369.1 hypothetical protein [Haloarchaeobius sp. HME9146]
MHDTNSIAITGLNEKQQRILTYLSTQAGYQTYFKSRLIGEAVGLSAKEVGANLAQILRSNRDVGLDIEKWGYSSGTTWKVTPTGAADVPQRA